MKGLVRELATGALRDHLSVAAAGMAFYAMLGVVPGFAGLVALYGLLADPAHVREQLAAFEEILPPEASALLLEEMESLVKTRGAALGMGALGAFAFMLWSVTTGMKMLMMALNVIHEEIEARSFLARNGVALALAAGAIVFAVVALGALVMAGGALRWPLLALLMVIGATLVYRYAPNRKDPRWAVVGWGALLATVLGLAGSGLFSLYVSRFGEFSRFYGSLGAVIVLMMWFLISAYALLIGAEANEALERRRRGRQHP